MDIATEAFKRLYPDKKLDYSISLDYSGKFKPYNANVQINKFTKELYFNLSKSWRDTNNEITIGLIQSLLIKILKDKKTKSTINIDLYNSFIKNLHISIPKDNIDAVLSESFKRVNEEYFYGLIEQPNLVWGNSAVSRLGSYSYQTDIITVSSIFRNAPIHLLDYIMYHEVLHKKHKFECHGTRNYHHTTIFRKAEKKFKNSLIVEKELKNFCKRARLKQIFFGF